MIEKNYELIKKTNYHRRETSSGEKTGITSFIDRIGEFFINFDFNAKNFFEKNYKENV